MRNKSDCYFNRFRGGIVPLGQIEGNMQMLMYAMKVSKKGSVLMSVKALLIS